MREKQLGNLLKAIDLLARPEGTTIRELCDELDITRRSVYRLIETLESLQFPVYDDQTSEGRTKRWRLEPDYVKRMPNMSLADLKLSFAETLSLYLLKGDTTLYEGTRLEAEARSAFKKIGALLPVSVFRQLDKIKTLFIPQSKFAKDYSDKGEIIDILAESMLRQKICMVSYFSFSSETEKQYLIEPLHFFESNGGMYVFVRVPKYDTIRTLAVERIHRIEQSTERFEYPDAFNPEKLLESAFDMIYDDPVSAKIWLSAGQAKYVRERKFFQKQTLHENPDGSLVLEIETSGRDDVKRWILSLGADAVVLEPERLRREIKAEITALTEKYRQR